MLDSDDSHVNSATMKRLVKPDGKVTFVPQYEVDYVTTNPVKKVIFNGDALTTKGWQHDKNPLVRDTETITIDASNTSREVRQGIKDKD